MKSKSVCFLSDIKVGQTAKIDHIDEKMEEKLCRRLLELGFVFKTEIKVANLSFFGEVSLVEINGYLLSIRKSIAEKIIVERVTK